MPAGERGYENGIWAMPAKARTAAREKGYEIGIMAMSAEARMAAREKGFKARSKVSNDKMGI